MYVVDVETPQITMFWIWIGRRGKVYRKLITPSIISTSTGPPSPAFWGRGSTPFDFLIHTVLPSFWFLMLFFLEVY